MADELKGQVAIVTGASAGIGRAIAARLGARGMKVALAARREEELEQTAGEVREQGGEALVVPTDVTDLVQVRALLARTEEVFGAVDLLVNNAGSLAAIGPSWEVEPEDWWQDQQVNVRGLFLCAWAVLRAMVERGRGRIVNLVGGGTPRPFPFASGYATSKAAVQRFTENVLEELRAEGHDRIHLFPISPGFVRTEMTEQFVATEEGRRYMDYMGDRFERGEHSPPEYAADLVEHIARGELDPLAGRYLHAAKHREKIEEWVRDPSEVLEGDLLTLVIEGSGFGR